MAIDLSVATRVLREKPARLDPVFEELERRVVAGDLDTAALAVGDADGAIRSEAFTRAKREVTPDSYFFLASVTKPIFATAFMRVVQDGLIGLDEPIARWLPEFRAGDKSLVTARHLLTHTSGVPDVSVEELGRQRPSAARMTRVALEAPLRYRPGARYEYCTVTFYLLAALIERASGLTYREYLSRHLLEPLGMSATFDPRRAGRPIVAVQGAGVDNRFVRFLMLRFLAGAALPGGGLFGTLDDLLRFGAALLRPVSGPGGEPVPISTATFAEMARDQLGGIPGFYDGQERAVHFGLGWGKPTLMFDLPGSPGVVSHGGATGTRLWIDPDAGLVFVFFTNRWAADRSPEAAALRGTYRAMGGAS